MSEAENVAQAAAPAAEIPSIAAQMRAEAAAESARIGSIRKACAGQHAEIESQAIAEGWDATPAEPEVLRDQVTSPNGTTFAGLQQMARRDFRGVLRETVLAATARSRELSKDG